MYHTVPDSVRTTQIIVFSPSSWNNLLPVQARPICYLFKQFFEVRWQLCVLSNTLNDLTIVHYKLAIVSLIASFQKMKYRFPTPMPRKRIQCQWVGFANLRNQRGKRVYRLYIVERSISTRCRGLFRGMYANFLEAGSRATGRPLDRTVSRPASIDDTVGQSCYAKSVGSRLT